MHPHAEPPGPVDRPAALGRHWRPGMPAPPARGPARGAQARAETHPDRRSRVPAAPRQAHAASRGGSEARLRHPRAAQGTTTRPRPPDACTHALLLALRAL